MAPPVTPQLYVDEDEVRESAAQLDEIAEDIDETEKETEGGTDKFAEAEENANNETRAVKKRLSEVAGNLRGAANEIEEEDSERSAAISQIAPDSPRNPAIGGNSLAKSANTGRINATSGSTSSTGAPSGSSSASKTTPNLNTPKVDTPTSAAPSASAASSTTTPASNTAPQNPMPAQAPMQPIAPPRAMQNPPMQSYVPQYPPPTQQQLMTQNNGMGAQQPSDMVSLTPEQMRILAEYLARKKAAEEAGHGDNVDNTRDLNLDGINGDFHEAVLEICERTVDANIPYAWGGGTLEGPSQGISDGGGPADQCGDYNKIGFDCSGFSRFVIYQTTGIEIPRTSQPQYNYCIPTDDPQIGDLGFPAGGNPGHVVVYVGGTQVCEAQQSGTTIMFSEDRNFVYGYVPGGPNDPSY